MRTTTLSLFLTFPLFFACTAKDEDQDWDTDSTSIESDGGEEGAGDGSDSGTENDTADTEPAGPTIWSGPTITFTKENGADSQDAITDLVILTRGNRGSLFNVVIETSASGISPLGTEWAKGTTAELDTLTFDNLKGAANNQMSQLPGDDYVLHLVEENIYIDVKFIGWTSGGSSGGGFSYERSTAG